MTLYGLEVVRFVVHVPCLLIGGAPKGEIGASAGRELCEGVAPELDREHRR